MSMIRLSLHRPAFAVLIVLPLITLNGCALQEALNQKTPAQIEAEKVALEKAGAEKGNPWDQYLYGEYLARQKNDYAAAHIWFMKSAQSGNLHGEEDLAWDYLTGRGGVPRNDALAASWMRKSADQGSASAQYQLAKMYGAGRGVPKDRSKQIEQLEKAAQQWNQDAIRELDGLGDPHGVARQMYARDNAIQQHQEDERRNAQQQNSQPAQQRMCSMNNGQVTYLAPC
jgi:TPR repeat protein